MAPSQSPHTVRRQPAGVRVAEFARLPPGSRKSRILFRSGSVPYLDACLVVVERADVSNSCSPVCSMIHSRPASDMVSPYRRRARRHSSACRRAWLGISCIRVSVCDVLAGCRVVVTRDCTVSATARSGKNGRPRRCPSVTHRVPQRHRPRRPIRQPRAAADDDRLAPPAGPRRHRHVVSSSFIPRFRPRGNEN